MTSYKWPDLRIHHLSESVFVGLCYEVGSSQDVNMRREMMDFREMMINQVIMKTREEDMDMEMTSGSYREGFRIKGSDVDLMYWPNDHMVIWDLNQAQKYDLSRKTLILCDCSDSPPGFALLELLTPTYRKSVKNACMRINSRLYISSSKYRKICSSGLPNSKEHGPCGSGVLGGEEFDIAQCFVCDFWPPTASKWIDRCHSWPPSYIVDDIVRNGCHFVAIGHKLGKHTDKEWRISFSLAEQKLVYSMNHCQFLTYGLLKLFLKECIINGLSDKDKLLCSYHLKTAVFWIIQQNITPQWCSQNLLHCFWVCFKLILKWVYEGVCPNFFIPENNMFLNNIHGEAQKNLFIRLHELYEKGLVSLFHCPTIRSSVISVLQNPRPYVGTVKRRVLFEKSLFNELNLNNIPTPDLLRCMNFLSAAEKLIILPPTLYQVLLLQKITVSAFQSTAFMSYNLLTFFASFKANTSSVVNKQVYIANKVSSYMVKLATKYGCISHMLFIAMFYYKALRYKEAILVLEMTKAKLAQPYVMYVNSFHYTGALPWYMYSKSIGEQSWSTKMRQAVAWDFILENTICYINELVPEQQSGLQRGSSILCIPLFVLLHMLEIFCYRHVDPVRAQTALNDLQNPVHHDQGVYIEEYKRDISWQILGICQQMTGNHEAALHSYQQSLQQEKFHNLETATFIRIIILVYRLYFS
ncbi:uncharacterized protein LOC134240632 [Saccostrea cucullata]|uniref:uncharacterized protein LOC134240632 n=1 Tax=Saccostrea cuccullata TaxID=36930 RepID=UPI002ED293EF